MDVGSEAFERKASVSVNVNAKVNGRRKQESSFCGRRKFVLGRDYVCTMRALFGERICTMMEVASDADMAIEAQSQGKGPRGTFPFPFGPLWAPLGSGLQAVSQ
jgi:hypothetical protein